MYTLNCKGKLLVIDKPIVMGIINTTPDSFFTDSRKKSINEALITAEQMWADGATMIDIGAQSTRSGAEQVGAEEETKRLIPIIEAINKKLPDLIISVDTYHSTVAKNAIEAGAHIVNDISAGDLDSKMLQVVSQLKVPYIAMHMQGTPTTMQQNPSYKNVTVDVLDYFIKKIGECHQLGINDIIIDVGFGFGKTIEHNYQLLKELNNFNILHKPILVGISRKSMIYKPLKTNADNALNGTTVLNTLALQNGASILRVHDVKAAVEVVQMTALFEGKAYNDSPK